MGGQGAWLELAKQGAWVESAREGDHGWSWQGPGVRAEPAARADGSMAGSMAKTRIPVYSGTALVAAEVRGGCSMGGCSGDGTSGTSQFLVDEGNSMLLPGTSAGRGVCR